LVELRGLESVIKKPTGKSSRKFYLLNGIVGATVQYAGSNNLS